MFPLPITAIFIICFTRLSLQFDPNSPAATYVHCYPAGFATDTGAGVPRGREGWWAIGYAADWYLAPATSGYDFSRSLYQLVGAPAVPPRYGMAFMATYWGYTTMQQVEGNMTAFRSGKYPIDSFIMDYDWFGPQPCGPPGAQGGLNCGDFGYEKTFFGNETFVHGDTSITTHGPAELLTYFHSKLNMRWAGIRKPRSYSNIQLSNASGWLLPDADSVHAGGNNWNYSIPEFRAWYTSNHLHFLRDGVDFWWNDEGETTYYTYYYWNTAQQQEWATVRPGQRMFTINRAFQPGMQRFPAVTWSGDGQDCSHTMAIRFIMNGQPYVACDMTSPDATVLVRQYQNAVFLPIMRAHQMHGVPRFPFLWCGPGAAGGGTAEHCTAFRKALNTRYAFLPYLYSLAHESNRLLRPMARPSTFEFPDYSPSNPAYMVGDSLLPADLCTSHTVDGTENRTTANLPPGLWYLFNTTQTLTGGRVYVQDNVPVTDFPVYVRPGAILTLQKAIVQYSDAIGGRLEVQVYAGRDGAFDMVEDDGTTTDYLSGGARTTHWKWDDAGKTLTWAVDQGSYPGGPNDYVSVQAVLFTPAGQPQLSDVVQISTGGSIKF
eukprot:m.261535 g.261535  ORF g.261535 m.261535 type:complete len:602 (+) comp24727_c0_seq1:570-2375(+)